MCRLTRFASQDRTLESGNTNIALLGDKLKDRFDIQDENATLEVSAYSESTKQPVLLKTHQQGNVPLSLTEVAYMALPICIEEVLWVKTQLLEIDSQGAIALTKNDGSKAEGIHLTDNPTEQQLADFLTKAIATNHFQEVEKVSRIEIFKSRGSAA
uniref:AlNc14C68G4749 protein n=1 Tax=Albugo laibachii Nc14 TaxID=890382 RepID=F0WDM8_9STRA|nr:AlNc14C68G4749 [Albugo laibachii Nc14]|eukprot:CCA19304.1 AlNc14C68G4749 [Albugo laibachii Nc14]